MKCGVWALVAFAFVVWAAPAHAEAGTVACGDVVIADVVLRAPLTGCADGLVVGADDVTIDLNGHSIEGLGSDAGIGILAEGRSGVTIRNGRIERFGSGVFVAGTAATVANLTVRDTTLAITVFAFATPSLNRITGNSVSSSVSGISIGGGGEVVGNTITDIAGTGVPGSGRAPGYGILCQGPVGSSLIAHNEISRAMRGISLVGCQADVVRNAVSESAGDGIYRERAPGRTERNRVNGNGGNGILALDSHGAFVGNITNANAGNGLWIVDSDPTHGPLHSVSGHHANANGGFGIFTLLANVVDGGGNKARANGQAAGCFGVTCN